MLVQRDQASPGPWMRRAAQLGYVARGAVYVVIGVTALAVAATGGEVAGRRGALRTLAEQPLGSALLLATVTGFGGYALWRFVQAGRELLGGVSLSAVWRAVFYGARGAFYGGTAWYAAGIVVTAERQEPSVTPLLALPPPSVAVAGVVAAGYAGFVAYRGVARRFEDDLAMHGLSDRRRAVARALGVAGHLSRAIAIAIVAAVMIAAGWGVDPVEDIGIDRALGELSAATAGPWLLVAVGLGLAAFGLFSLIQARYRRIEVPSADSAA